MLAIVGIQICVRDFDAALRFWTKGLQLELTSDDQTDEGRLARLEFPDGGPEVVLVQPVGELPPPPAEPGPLAPGVSFDLATSEFDATLIRLIEHGGRRLGEIETYGDLRVTAVADPDGNAFGLIELPELEDEEYQQDEELYEE